MKTLFASSIIGIVLTVFVSTADSATITFRQGDSLGWISATDATKIATGSPNTNYGSSVEIETFGGASKHYALIRYPNIFGTDPSQIPYDSTIVSATLTLTVSNPGNDSVKDHYVYRVLTDWAENTVTYNSFKGGQTFSSRYDHTVIDSFKQTYAGTFDIDLTSLIQGYANQDYPNYGVLIENVNYSWAVWWHSDDATNFTNRPLLTVNYTSPAPAIPEPATVLLILSGLIIRSIVRTIRRV